MNIITHKKKLLSIIDDGHIALWGDVGIDKQGIVSSGIYNYAYVPVEFDYVDGIVYVINVSQKDSLHLQKYDVLKRINGQSIERRNHM